jgi:beta-lactamase regulating signal transducer with metallopeptidase domain
MSITNETLQTLALALLHFLWQGAAIAAFAAGLYSVIRRPSARYAIGMAALVLMVVSFGITVAVVGVGADTVSAETRGLVADSPREVSAFSNYSPDSAPAAASPSHDAVMVWIARGWIIGVGLFALRLAFGLAMLAQLRRRRLEPLPAALVNRFDALRRRLGIQRVVRFCECGLVAVPAVIGLMKPVVLLPMRALTGLTPEQLDAVIAHELAHVRRFDVIANLFQIVGETLFFFHPAVWWLNRRIRADREDCCDDVAVSVSGSHVGLARALVDMESWRAVPTLALAVNGSPIAARVARLLGVNRAQESRATTGVITTTLVLAATLVTGAASVGFARPAEARNEASNVAELAAMAAADAESPASVADPGLAVAPAAAPAVIRAPAPVSSLAPARAPVIAPAPATAPAPAIAAVPAVRATPAPVAAPRAAPAPSVPATPAVAPAPASPPAPAHGKRSTAAEQDSFIEEMQSLDLDVDVDALVALKVHGVTTTFVKEIRSMGLDVGVDELVAIKVHDVSPQFVQDIRSLGLDPSTDDLIAMKVHGVDSNYFRTMQSLGLEIGADDLIAMKIHGVSPEYVKRMRANGLDAGTEDLIAMKIHDVTPEYRKALEAKGLKLNVEELVEAKVLDITPEFVERARKHGFKDLSIEQLIHLRYADVL